MFYDHRNIRNTVLTAAAVVGMLAGIGNANAVTLSPEIKSRMETDTKLAKDIKGCQHRAEMSRTSMSFNYDKNDIEEQNFIEKKEKEIDKTEQACIDRAIAAANKRAEKK